ncbi:DUF4417 domain-containing protein [Bifidobacterium thermophilum]|uniref:DUF4417 domain-containing protein n=1 Tax=Bifidobacterium thermophilum TaxID=33905 RepID=UPI003096DB2C
MSNYTVHYKSRKDNFHGYMVDGATFARPFDIPIMQPCHVIPKELISFSEAMRTSRDMSNAFVHFYEHDEKIERFWNNPRKYMSKLRSFAGVIAPDYSLCRDFPESLKIWNTYRNYACGYWLQSQGLAVIANIRLSGKNSESYALAGAPRNSVIAIGAHGNIRFPDNQDYFFTDVAKAVNTLHPTAIIVYGTDSYGMFEYPRALGIPIHFFKNHRYAELERTARNDEAAEQRFQVIA